MRSLDGGREGGRDTRGHEPRGGILRTPKEPPGFMKDPEKNRQKRLAIFWVVTTFSEKIKVRTMGIYFWGRGENSCDYIYVNPGI
jgi:hypothetical protein